MLKNHKKLYILLFIATFFIFVLINKTEKKIEATDQNIPITPVFKTIESTKPSVLPSPELNSKTEKSEKIKEDMGSVTVLAGNTKINLESKIIFYDALVKARDSSKIEFSGKNYPGLGFFVTDIGTLHAGAGKYLLYYINGKEATVGVSAYTLKDGDIIEWKLE